MKLIFKLLILSGTILLLNQKFTYAQDTIHVQCFTYGSSTDSSIVFPYDTVRIQKILMNYKLRCPYTTQCGEWDYLMYTYLFQPTGRFDSVMHTYPSYVVNGSSPASYSFMNTPSYSYHPYFENHVVQDSIISFDSTLVAANTISMNHPLNAAIPVCRSQYLWKAVELTAAGLSAGNITGLRLNVLSPGSELKHLVIRIKATTRDTITILGYESTGFITVYDRNTTFTPGGWNPVEFTGAFLWDGVSNLAVDISYGNDGNGTSTSLSGSNSGFQSGITTANEDRSFFFQGTDNISVPSQPFGNLDSNVTISFWANGNPLFQPQNQSIFEGVDSLNRRVLNCHLPWSDGVVYWDAGNSGTTAYDRLSKQATSPDFEGNWVHWAFTKNVKSGRMKIYKNGASFIQATNKRKLMKGIKKFRIGSGANGTSNYDGNIDEFAVFNTEVDAATIKDWMNKKMDSSHPYYSNLLLYYTCDNNSLTAASDSAPGNNNGLLFGVPVSSLYTPTSVFKDLMNTDERPDVIFEQGIYFSHVDSVMLVDSTVNAPVTMVYFSDTLNPTVPTDSQLVYPVYYNQYVYDAAGHAIDSAFVTPDSVITLYNTHTWDPPYAVQNRYELGRYITPYGNGLSLGNGFNWVYDVSDYRTLLHDTVHLKSYNQQELLDLSFDMIKGIPPRDPISVQNIYPGGDFVYGSAGNPIENHFPPKNIYIDSSALNTRIKYRTTGHGEDGNNCDEFCPKMQYINVNSIQRFSQLVWKDDCALNPVYPQGGTWVYARANWCPGDDVPTFDYELTPYATPGDSVLIDVNFQPYTLASGGSNPHCVVETQLIEYGAPNFTLDAAVYDIKSPSDQQMYLRHNPICNNPLVTIQNTGSTTLTSLTITYGQVGASLSTFNWTGSLTPMKKTDVQLGNVNWNAAGNQFIVTVSNPNGGTDQYANNNTMTTTFGIPPQFENALIFELQTNNESYQNAYTLKDDQGNVVFSRSSLTDNTLYEDTMYLPSGCYEFRLTDSGDDGLTFWANPPGGAGSMKIKRASDGAALKSFGSDFGAEIYQQFTVGYMVGIENSKAVNDVRVYPNPSTGKVNFDLNFSSRQNATIELFNVTGGKVYAESAEHIISKRITADLSFLRSGIYFVKIKTDEHVYYEKVVMGR
ncbi:MAG: peptide-N-glycosidase F-related protein [Bacteroidetes bacterium]|nr:peptide-N-glycosidase F-related protein [Bacteroidota bacterium]